MRRIESVLYAQSGAFMQEQRRYLLDSGIGERLDASLHFASEPSDIEAGSRFDVLIAPTLPWLPELLRRVDGLQWVHLLSSGVDKIWSMEVDWTQLKLTSSKGPHAVPISEYVLGAMLHFAKRFDEYVVRGSEGIRLRERTAELSDMDVVIVGGGSIGRAVAGLVRGLGAHPTLVARTPRTDPVFGGVLGFERLSEVLHRADYLVVAVPLTEQTRGLVGASLFKTLKPGSVLIDVSRGGVVVADDLVHSLDTGHLRGAALDVFEEEPLPGNSPLWGRRNVLITPHIAGTSPKYIQRALEIFESNARQYLAGRNMSTAVDASRGY